MRFHLQAFLVTLLLGNTAMAAPDKIFLSASQRIPEEPPRFWGGEAVELEIISHRQLPEPEVFVLSKALAAPLRMEGVSYLTTGLKDGLHLHKFSFTAPQPRLQQRFQLRFGGEGATSLLFDVYPDWLREQVSRKAAFYEIQIEPEHSGAAKFFTGFESGNAVPAKRPVIKIVDSEHELIVRKSAQTIIWKTDCDQFDASDPADILRFETLLDTLKTLNKE